METLPHAATDSSEPVLQFTVTIKKATCLSNVDGILGGVSDPYCLCEVAGLRKHTRYTRFQTSVAKNNLDPEWNHTSVIAVTPKQSLDFQVWSRRTKPLPDKLIGSVELDRSKIHRDFDGELRLVGDHTSGTLEVTVVPPRIFNVALLSARDLLNVDGILAGVSDPYCICQISGMKKHTKGTRCQTEVVSNNLNPIWDYVSDIIVAAGQHLEFQVWDSNTKPLPDRLLGTVQLENSQFDPQGFYGELKLTGAKATGALQVRVAALPPSAIGSAVHVRLTEGMELSVPTHDMACSDLEEPNLKFNVTIEGASDLSNLDGILAGVSDPYCICEVAGLKKHTRYTRFQTKVVGNSLNPEWKQTSEVAMGPNQALEFQVWDRNTKPLPDQLIGKARLEGAPLHYGFRGELHLSGHRSSGFVTVSVVPPSMFLVTIKAAFGLRDSDGFLAGESDPYCLCQVAGLKRHCKMTRFMTPVVQNNLNPSWHHTSTVSVEPGQTLEFQVWDSNTKPLPDQLLGTAQLDRTAFDERGYHGELELSGSEATGKVRIEISALSLSMGSFPEAIATLIESIARGAMRWSSAQIAQDGMEADAAHDAMDRFQKELACFGWLHEHTCTQLVDMAMAACALALGETFNLGNIGELVEDFRHARDSKHGEIADILWGHLERVFLAGGRLTCAEAMCDCATIEEYTRDFDRSLRLIRSSK
mmetsp:Transcript_103612/g.292435  ORF Transcript_103612/g.292435 Transcript_103612/m.292435 type:complete len:701 (-) Transcript_103612:22-2124(-)